MHRPNLPASTPFISPIWPLVGVGRYIHARRFRTHGERYPGVPLRSAAFDPSRLPTWMNNIPRFTHSVSYRFSTLTGYSRYTDLTGLFGDLATRLPPHPTDHFKVSDCEAQSPPIQFAVPRTHDHRRSSFWVTPRELPPPRAACPAFPGGRWPLCVCAAPYFPFGALGPSLPLRPSTPRKAGRPERPEAGKEAGDQEPDHRLRRGSARWDAWTRQRVPLCPAIRLSRCPQR